jgi:Fe-S cluster assembly protein SufD
MVEVAEQASVTGVDAQIANFSLAERLLARVGSSALHERRKAALNRFSVLGFPTTKLEDWRFTSITPISTTAFRFAELPHKLPSAGSVAEHAFGAMEACRIVCVNGQYAAGLSDVSGLPDGVVVGSLGNAIAADDPHVAAVLGRQTAPEEQAFEALNTAFLWDGIYVFVPRGTVVRVPIYLVFLAAPGDSPTVCHPRVLIVAEDNSQASFVEVYATIGDGICLTNAVTELAAGENAIIDHYRVQHESTNTYHIGAMCIAQGRSSNVTATSVALGAGISRNSVRTVLGGDGASCELLGLYMASGNQLVDNHTVLDHAQPHCASREFYKGILDDKAQAVFHGRIIVRPDAQKTDAKQTNKNLVLSPDATINTKPQLEIYADDVKCTHGATIGQLDEEPLFYLRSRGISADAARNILVHAFAGDIVSRVKVLRLREELERLLVSRLPQPESAERS